MTRHTQDLLLSFFLYSLRRPWVTVGGPGHLICETRCHNRISNAFEFRSEMLSKAFSEMHLESIWEAFGMHLRGHPNAFETHFYLLLFYYTYLTKKIATVSILISDKVRAASFCY